MTRFALDIDGVAADYRQGVRDVMATVKMPPLTQPVGLDADELSAVMEQREEDRNTVMRDYITAHLRPFFITLPSLVTEEDLAAINAARSRGHELFWVSSRSYSSGQVSRQPFEVMMQITLDWLHQVNLPVDRSHLLLTPDKAQTIRDNQIRYHLEDMVPHATQVAFNSEAQVYLLRQPWNRRMIFRHPDQEEYTAEVGAFGIPEVDSIAEYITLVTQGVK